MSADLVPFLLGQLDNLTTAPTVYLGLVAVVALTAVFSKRRDRRAAALEVLRLLLPGRRPQTNDGPSPDSAPSPDP